jgi:hypothetical protein
MAFVMLRDVRLRWVRNALCLPFAAAMLILSSRTAVDCISTLALSSSRLSPSALGHPFETGAVDHKPKPTRQLERTSIDCLVQLKWLILSKPASPVERDWRIVVPPPVHSERDGSSDFDGVQATKPAYLRASERVPQDQLPPPSLAFALV